MKICEQHVDIAKNTGLLMDLQNIQKDSKMATYIGFVELRFRFATITSLFYARL